MAVQINNGNKDDYFTSTGFSALSNTTYELSEDITLTNSNVFMVLDKNTIFDGKGYTIDICNNYTKGLFSVNTLVTEFDSAPVIKNLTVRNAKMIETGSGVICSESTKSVKINNVNTLGCSIDMSDVTNIHDRMHFGGIVGRNCGYQGHITIKNCTTDIELNAQRSGGIISLGAGEGGILEIENCTSTGNITVKNCSGIAHSCGYDNSTVIIRNCQYTGNMNEPFSVGIVSSRSQSTGKHEIHNCIVSGNMNNYKCIGIAYFCEDILITNCIVSGQVNYGRCILIYEGSSYDNKVIIQNCYSTSNYNGTDPRQPHFVEIETSEYKDNQRNGDLAIYAIQNCYLVGNNTNFIEANYSFNVNDQGAIFHPTNVYVQNCYALNDNVITNGSDTYELTTIDDLTESDSGTSVKIINANYNASLISNSNSTLDNINDTSIISSSDTPDSVEIRNDGSAYISDDVLPFQYPLLKVFRDAPWGTTLLYNNYDFRDLVDLTVTEISSNSITINVSYDGDFTEIGIDYGTEPNELVQNISNTDGTNVFTIEDLSPATEYYIQAYKQTATQKITSNTIIIYTKSTIPRWGIVETGSLSDIPLQKFDGNDKVHFIKNLEITKPFYLRYDYDDTTIIKNLSESYTRIIDTYYNLDNIDFFGNMSSANSNGIYRNFYTSNGGFVRINIDLPFQTELTVQFSVSVNCVNIIDIVPQFNKEEPQKVTVPTHCNISYKSNIVEITIPKESTQVGLNYIEFKNGSFLGLSETPDLDGNAIKVSYTSDIPYKVIQTDRNLFKRFKLTSNIEEGRNFEYSPGTYNIIYYNEDESTTNSIVEDEILLVTTEEFELTNSNIDSLVAYANIKNPPNPSLSTTLVRENLDIGVVVAIIDPNDPDSVNDSEHTHTYTFINESPYDNNFFELDGNVIKLKQTLDYETKQEHIIKIRVTDNKGVFTDKEFTLNVVDFEDAKIYLDGTGAEKSVLEINQQYIDEIVNNSADKVENNSGARTIKFTEDLRIPEYIQFVVRNNQSNSNPITIDGCGNTIFFNHDTNTNRVYDTFRGLIDIENDCDVTIQNITVDTENSDPNTNLLDNDCGYLITNLNRNRAEVNYDATQVTSRNSNITVLNCINNIPINGGELCGGLIGANAGAFGGSLRVENCTNNGDINSIRSSGICGTSPGRSGGASYGGVTSEAIFINCTNNGNINGNNSSGLAQFIGANGGNGTIENCTNTGIINGNFSSGILNNNCGSSNGNCNVSGCINTGDIIGFVTSGIVGYRFARKGNGTIKNCYSKCNMTGEYCGGIAGYFAGAFGNELENNKLVIQNCYYIRKDSNSTIGNNSGGILGDSAGRNDSKNYPVVLLQNCYCESDFLFGPQYNPYRVIVQNCYSTFSRNDSSTLTHIDLTGNDYFNNAQSNFHISQLANKASLTNAPLNSESSYTTTTFENIINAGDGYLVDFKDENRGYPVLRSFVVVPDSGTLPDLDDYFSFNITESAIDDFNKKGKLSYTISSAQIDSQGNTFENIVVTVRNSNNEVQTTGSGNTSELELSSGTYTLEVSTDFNGTTITKNYNAVMPNINFNSQITTSDVINLESQLTLQYSFSDNVKRITRIEIRGTETSIDITNNLNGSHGYAVSPGLYLLTYYIDNDLFKQVVFTININDEAFNSIKVSAETKTIQEGLDSGLILEFKNNKTNGLLEATFRNNSTPIYRTTDDNGDTVIEYSLDDVNKHTTGNKKIEILINNGGDIVYLEYENYFAGFNKITNRLHLHATS